MPAMLGSRSPCKRAVTAPMDLPQRPIVDAFLTLRRCSTMSATSSRSNQPSEMNSPSDKPHPGKSKQNSVMFAVKKQSTSSSASNLQDELPCMQMTQGIVFQWRTVSSGSKWLHCIFSPFELGSSRSVRSTRCPDETMNSLGPMSAIEYSARGGRIIACQIQS